MSRFYGDLQGNRGTATRQGTANSGIHGHIRGWYVGIRVEGSDVNGEDVFSVWLTGGSNGYCSSTYLGKARVANEYEFTEDGRRA